MEALDHLRGASFSGQTIEVITRAFDDAWEAIADEIGNNPITIEEARRKLANAILASAREDSRDPEELKNAALFNLVREHMGYERSGS